MIPYLEPVTVALLVAAAVAAVLDWIVCARAGEGRGRGMTKGLTPALLVAAVTVHAVEQPKPSWTAVIAAGGLCLCLLGDVLLLDAARFDAGTLAFGAAQLVLTVAMLQDGRPGGVGVWVALAVVIVGFAVLGRRVVAGAVAHKEGGVVGLYLLLISLMVVAAGIHAAAPFGWYAFAGALLLYGSDGLLGRRRYVSERGGDSPLVMITYHAGLFLFTAWAIAA